MIGRSVTGVVRSSDEGVSSTFAFIVAVGIMLGSVAVVYQATGDVASQGVLRETEQVNLQSEAAALKGILIDSPGVVAGGGAWDQSTNTSDTIERLGLLSPDGAGIQMEKLRNLRLAPFEADPTDGYANYEEVKTALGLDDKGLDFHIRAKPNLKSVEDILNDPTLRDQHLKVTYIGSGEDVKKNDDGDDVPIDEGLVIDNLRCEASPTGGPSYRFSVDITNGGTTPTQFLVVFKIDAGTKLTRQDQTGIVAPDATTTAYVDVEYVSGFSCNEETEVDLSVLDPVQQIHDVEIEGPTLWSDPPSTDDEFYMKTDGRYVLPTDVLRLDYYGDEKKGDGLTFAIRPGTDPAAASVYDLTTTVADKSEDRYLEIPAGTLAAGEYTAYLTHAPSDVIATQRVIVVAGGSEPDPYTPPSASGGSGAYVMDPAVAIEVQFLDDLISQFCPTFYYGKVDSPISTDWNTRCAFKSGSDPALLASQPGDVFPSVTKPALEDLMDRLVVDTSGNPNDWVGRYDVVDTLIVGSNVPQQAMNGNGNFGKALDKWVRGGGTLVVFGSPNMNTNWMNDIFKVKGASSSGGISAPDVSHSLLTTPESLSYDDYVTGSEGWQYTGNNQDQFTDVVKQGDTPVTAVSDPGDYDEGTIIITTWLPYDLFGNGAGSATDEGLRLMHNFMSQGYRDLFLDYGPPLPDGVPAIPAAGRSFVDHPDLGQLTLDFTLYVFPSS